jgi:hypothetical protein
MRFFKYSLILSLNLLNSVSTKENERLYQNLFLNIFESKSGTVGTGTRQESELLLYKISEIYVILKI